MLNPFFLQGSKTEQGLVQSLINESIQIHGIDVYYIPRKYVNEKTIIREVIESEFKNAYPIEAYINSYEGYEGQGTLLSKFGIQELDDLSIIISKERFEIYITPILRNIPDVKLPTRPKEGDLIYFPLGDKLFEIKYVEHEQPFYQLRENYVYELKCELFRYSEELLDTGIDYIDDNVESEGYIQTLTLVGSASTAYANATSVNGGVRFIEIINRGSGYKSSPQVKISSPPPPGEVAIGIATMISGIVDICEPDGNLLRVQGVELTKSGFGYQVAPSVSFIGGGGSGAKAIATIADGVVGIITITNGGSGYITPPEIYFNSPEGGEPAIAVAVLENGSVSLIRIIDGGYGYNQEPNMIIPTLTIESPPIIIGSGTYQMNEKIRGSISNVTARVKKWNKSTRILEVSNVSGTFIPGEILIGEISNAQYKLNNVQQFNINDPFGENKEIQEEANTIIDFSEKNPFGIP